MKQQNSPTTEAPRHRDGRGACLGFRRSALLFSVSLCLCGWLPYAAGGEMTVVEAQRILKEETADANALFSVSFCFEQAGRPFSAIRAAERAIEVDGKVPGYHARLGQLFAARKRFRDAAAAYGRAADMDPATKSFRAAEARALAGCLMLPEAAASWKKLLDGATDRQEVLDAARNLAGIRYQLGDPVGAEAAWTAALGKLTEWDDRLAAAAGVSAAMLGQKAVGRAMGFWDGLFAKETDWDRRAALADRMRGLVSEAAAAGLADAKAAAIAEKAWRTLLAEARKPAEKQRAALAAADIDMRAGAAAKAVELLQPVLYASDWNANWNAAQALASALAAAGRGEEIEKLWREFLEKSGGYDQRSRAAEMVAGCIDDPAALVEFRREMVRAFPDELSAHDRLADALAAAERYTEAAGVVEAALPLLRRAKGYQVDSEYGHWQRLVELYCRANDPARALALMQDMFSRVNNTWQVNSWFLTVRNVCGEYAALNAADRLGDAGGIRRLGAGEYLLDYGRQGLAVPLLEASAADTKLGREHRREALQRLLNVARTDAARLDIARRMVELGGERWEHTQALRTLAQYLARQGGIEEGCGVVRKADGLRDNQWRAGPDVLQHLTGSIFQGNRVGPGLRTPDGQKKAEDAAAALYRDFAATEMYRSALAQFVCNLAELHARRGDYDGAVEFIHAACAVRDAGELRLAAADLLDRKGDDAGALKEHLAYSDAEAAAYAEWLRKRDRNKGYGWILSLDGRFLSYLEAKGKDDDYIAYAGRRMEETTGPDREGLANALLGFYKARNRPEDMQALLGKLKDWGVKGDFYRQQEQWVAAAIKMKNASSQADAQRRDQLLKQADDWKKRLGENPEDYGAAINAYKTYVLLGRREPDGKEFLDKVKDAAVKQRDPLVLELWGREMMLEKSYASAVRAFELASEVTGRRMDYEESLSSALELSGKHKEAITLALDSLEDSLHGGRGFRSVEQILDMAERSDNLKHLHAEAGKRARAARAAGRPMREAAAQLALRLAWDNADEELSSLAIDELAAQGRDPSRPWQEEWRLESLAERAAERRRLADAARVRRIVLDAHAAAGYAPDLGEHQRLAGLLLEAGRSGEAADVMFSGLERAGTGQARPVYRDRYLFRSSEGKALPPVSAARRSPEAPWVAAILGLAALEASVGADVFRKACGDRLTALIEAEVAVLEDSPAAYTGALLGCDAALGVRERVTAAFRAAAAAGKSTTADHMALARRLVTLACIVPRDNRPEGLTLGEIVAACKTAAERTESSRRSSVLMETARLYARLLAPPPSEAPAEPAVLERAADATNAPPPGPALAGATPEMVLDVYEAAAAGSAEGWGLDALREELSLAQRYGIATRALDCAQRLNKVFPEDADTRNMLAAALLDAGKPKEALTLLQGALGADSPWSDFAAAADLCMRGKPSPSPEAAAGASALYSSAIAAYQEETGKQVDAQGKPLPDSGLASLQARLSAACAAEGRPGEALAALVASFFNSGGTVAEPSGAARLAEAYARAGKSAELAAEMEARVTADPTSLNLRLAQATVLEKAGDFAGAANALAAAKAIKPELSIVRRLIEMLRRAGQTREALAECRAWADSFPRDGDAYRAMADVYRELKDEGGEIAALTMLVEVAPREAANCREVAVLFAGRKDWPRALALAERAVELRPEEPYRHLDVAEVLLMSAIEAGEARRAEVPAVLQRAAKICNDALQRDWEKGLAPELLARMPPWKGTFETRAHSLLADIHELAGREQEAARERLSVPAGYKRPELKDAVPTPGLRNWWRGGPRAATSAHPPWS